MITDAEKQRQADMKETEDFTRCRVGKGRGRGAAFEYTDIDTGSVVTSEEYERR
jgi:hypothetical protein